MSRYRRLSTLITVIVGAVLLVSPASGLNEPTHELINLEATSRSSLDKVLKNQLDMPEGIREIIRGTTETNRVNDWIRLGGRREDEGTFSELLLGRARFLRHFLDPLQPWDRAGLSLPLFIRFESSVRWAQRTNQDGVTGHGNYSWSDARRYYLTALTAGSPTDREQAFADTFRALGQIMHLIVDASVPEHVRDDVHPLGPVFGNYEYWVLDAHTRQGAEAGLVVAYISAPIPPEQALFEIPIPAGESVARVPIARLFDSDRYMGTNPGVTAGAPIGIAEVANANFLSEDTRHGQYPHPARANMERYVRLYSKTGLPRAYYKMRPGFGLPVDPVAQECALNELIGTDELCVDTDVWRETARHMLPRAVGYSAGLLDYFFRGKLDFEINLDEAEPDDPTRLRLVIKNGGSEPMAGEFTIYAEDADGKRDAVTSAQRTVDAGSQSDPVLFTPPRDIEKLILVFRGTLGQEEGAVEGTVKPWVPYVFAIQENAALTAEEVLTDRVEMDSGIFFRENVKRSKNAGSQRASGRFFVPGKPEAGKYLKRAWLHFDSAAMSTWAVRLRFDDQDVGPEWNRETSPIETPSRWEVVVDLPAPGREIGYKLGPSGTWVPIVVWDLPRFLVMETVAGTRIKAPLVWWRSSSSLSTVEARSDLARCPADGDLLCFGILETHRIVSGSPFYGDGDPDGRDAALPGEPYPLTAPHTVVHFTPTGEVAGYGVGTLESSFNFPIVALCPAAGEYSDRGVKVFVDRLEETLGWNKNEATVSRIEYTVVRGPIPSEGCARPPANLPEPPPLPTLTFKRDYLPAEQTLFQVLNITPPDYQITLQ